MPIQIKEDDVKLISNKPCKASVVWEKETYEKFGEGGSGVGSAS